MVQHLCIGEAVCNDKGLEAEEMDLRMLLVDPFWCVLFVLGTGEWSVAEKVRQAASVHDCDPL